MSLLPRITLHSDSEHLLYVVTETTYIFSSARLNGEVCILTFPFFRTVILEQFKREIFTHTKIILFCFECQLIFVKTFVLKFLRV